MLACRGGALTDLWGSARLYANSLISSGDAASTAKELHMFLLADRAQILLLKNGFLPKACEAVESDRQRDASWPVAATHRMSQSF